MLGGILLVVATLLALGLANSPWREDFSHFWHTLLTVSFGGHGLSKPCEMWISDGLMVIFFFLVGLELKREFIHGALTDLRRAAVPLAAALGGMVIPAAMYALVLHGGEGASGWGIPMATDIAFALGVLTLLGDRVPAQLRVFLATLAVIDDLGAILVIAVFYTAEISLPALGMAAVLLAVAGLGNRLGVRGVLFYALIGILLWLALLESGVHATIAGVLLAFTVPLKPRHLAATEINVSANRLVTATTAPDQVSAANALGDLAASHSSPAALFEHHLATPVALLILPLFALANAGVSLSGPQALSDPVAWGIAAGLVLGKPLGVMVAAWLCLKSGAGALAPGLTWRHLHGAAWLAGIGFTMSLFITNLAFASDSPHRDAAKVAILGASFVAGIVGVLILRRRTVMPALPAASASDAVAAS